MDASLLSGLTTFRWIAWGWMAVVLLLAGGDLAHPVPAIGLVTIALLITIGQTLLLRREPARLTRPRAVVGEVAVGVALLGADGWVYAPPHVFTAEQSLGVAWPLAGVLAAGVVFGPAGGAAGGVAMGMARAVSSIANLPDSGPGATLMLGRLTPQEVLSLLSTTVLYALAGGIGGYVARLLRRAEREVSVARAREEVARTLHDGVLQTLAVVERRTEDPVLAQLARDQERDLREWLFGVPGTGVVGRGDLGDELRGAAARFETTYGGRATVLVPDDLPRLSGRTIAALGGAVGEALTNAGKHGGAGRVTVYVEPTDDGVFCSVKDDGAGFDTDDAVERVGLTRSIRGRVEEVGGEVEIDSAPGRGTEVRLTLPARPS